MATKNSIYYRSKNRCYRLLDIRLSVLVSELYSFHKMKLKFCPRYLFRANIVYIVLPYVALEYFSKWLSAGRTYKYTLNNFDYSC